MKLCCKTLTRPFDHPEALLRGRYGVIEVRGGKLAAIHLRPWPKIISALEIEWWGRRHHALRAEDCCRVYYNQPWRYPNFLALKYMVSGRGCTLATVYRSLDVLDEVARRKRTDAILCDVWNSRISERLLARRGWEPHRPSRWHRHYIKRFYGVYPPMPTSLTSVIDSDAVRQLTHACGGDHGASQIDAVAGAADGTLRS